jgi:hypothetical protein
MAQPLFDEHPLQDYLRRTFFTSHPLSHHILNPFTESGDVFQPIPGAISDLSGPFTECIDPEPEPDLNLWSWLPTSALHLAGVSLSLSRFLPSAFRWMIRLL